MTNYLRIPLNEEKRHFVVGDIHGRYTTFLNLLEEIDYNKETDMIYSVGDMIDRGPQSVEVIEFFKQSNTYACLGNHEQMVNNPRDWEACWMFPPNGGPATLASLEEHGLDISWLRRFCKQLPVVIDVGDDDHPFAFRLVHAECPVGWSEDFFRETLQVSDPMDLAEGELLWGRKTISRAVRNLDHMALPGAGIDIHPDFTTRNIFCGHTPTERIVKVGKQWWIDTFRGRTMSMMNAVTHEKYSVEITNPYPGVI